MSTPFLKFGKLIEKTWVSLPMTALASGLLYVNNGVAKEIKQLKIINEERHHKETGASHPGDIQKR
ncbi:hypothetical protein BOTCAL_0039g00070 [Botryotinia calthae]|uniref:Uncharacterized protein n=1 Tax=Botryotinia calthae TaxID=38488 RepID=A0A4Y8DCU6_9HELO|nr:hypothetical protein BOTCAL_0039g00070 [Botryotinia calthae]